MNDTVPEQETLAPKPKKERRLEYFEGSNKMWYWRLRAIANKKITQTSGEGYSNQANLKRAMDRESKFWNMDYIDGPVFVKF